MLKITKFHSLDSLPFLFTPESLNLINFKEIVKKYPQVLQFVKYSKDTNKMKVKITEEIFSDNLLIRLK